MMSAIITTTTQTVELVLKNDDRIVSTQYHDSIESAISQAEQLGVTSIDFDELDF